MEEKEEIKEEVTEEVPKEEAEPTPEEQKEEIETLEENPPVEKPKKKGLIIGIVVGVCVFFILIVCLLFFFVIKPKMNRSSKTEMSDEEIIKDYGSKLEKVISDYKKEEGALLDYEEANTVLDYDYDVVCDVHEIYLDAKIYLDQCKIGKKKVSFSYGTKQKEKAEAADGDAYVYVSKSTHKATLEEPKNKDDYEVYTMHIGERYTNMGLLGETSEYVFYMDNKNKGQMRNYKTDKKVLSDLDYLSALPIRFNKQYDQDYVAIQVKVSVPTANPNHPYTDLLLWGIYQISTQKKILPFEYQSFSSYGYKSTNFHFEALADGYVLADRETNGDGTMGSVENPTGYGIINYRTGEIAVPTTYSGINKVDPYYYGTPRYASGSKIQVFDLTGKKYLTDYEIDKVFSSDYILAKKAVEIEEEDPSEEPPAESEQETTTEEETENTINPRKITQYHYMLINVDGKEIYDFGEKNLHTLYYGKKKGQVIVFEYVNDEGIRSKCTHFEYHIDTKEGFVDTNQDCNSQLPVNH